MNPFPFAKPKENVATAPTEAAPAAAKAAKPKGENRKKPAAQMNAEQVKQILALVKDFSYSEIAEKVGVTKFQVNRVLMNTKKKLRESAASDPAKQAKVEAYIKQYLSRPEDTLPGHGGGRSGKVKGTLDDVVSNILASIG